MKFKKIKYLFFFVTLFINTNINSQEVYEDVLNRNIYNFLDELANEKIISLNSSIKPYSKDLIRTKLTHAYKKEKISQKLKEEIAYYLEKYKDYRSENLNQKIEIKMRSFKIVFKDSESFVIVKPIWGYKSSINKNGKFQHLYGGLSADINLNRNWAIYANLRDNTMSEGIAKYNYFSSERGGNYKTWLNNDFSEMKGGVIYSFKKGSIGLVKEHIEWGDNYFGSNILSGRTPSFPLIKLNLKISSFLELNYLHGWLVSEDIDSSSSYYSSSGDYRGIFREKYIAANLIAFNITKHTILSLGNSIIYGDINGIHPGYLFPFFFYKSIDHTLNNGVENQNSQFFINVSSREIKHLHVYSSLFVDEFQKDRVFIDSLNNFLSFKIGVKISNWPISNISNIFEFNQTNPMTYQHTVEGTSFESNQYNLGHYMRDNSKVINYKLLYKINKKLKFSFDYLYAFHGDEVKYNFNNGYDPTAIPILENKTWDNKSYKLKIAYELTDNIFINLEYLNSTIQGYDNNNFLAQYYLDRFTPAFYHGKNNTFTTSINIGF